MDGLSVCASSGVLPSESSESDSGVSQVSGAIARISLRHADS